MAAEGGDPKAVPEGYIVRKEGQASILQHGNDVFFNEAQVTNRDLSVAVLRRFLPVLREDQSAGALKKSRDRRRQKQQKAKGNQQDAANGDDDKADDGQPQEQQQQDAAPQQGEAAHSTNPKQQGAHVLEGLAATGLRAIRYALEVPGIARIDANDMDRNASESIRRNVAFNGEEATSRVHAVCHDVRHLMMQANKRYHVVDLDPYGTPAPFLDTAVQSVAEGGLLAVTATDMANLCGNQSVACWSNYGSYPLHRPYCHEQALRILLACIETHASRYRRHIVPLLSVSVDFYIRVFVRVYTSPAAAKDAPTRLSYVWQSSGCDSHWLQRMGQKKVNANNVKYMPAHGPAVPDIKCPDCESNYLMGGPIWSDPIHDTSFVTGLLQDLEQDKARYAQYAKLRGLLTSVVEELPDAPLYYDLHDVCKTIKCQPPKQEVIKSALINAGYRVSGSHANPNALKTDAPSHALWDVLRCWVKDHPVSIKDPNSYQAKILGKAPTLQASFARAPGAVRPKDGPARFPENPAYWGPKAKHGRQAPGTSGQQQQQQQPASNAAGEQQEGDQGAADQAEASKSSEAAAGSADQVQQQEGTHEDTQGGGKRQRVS